MRLFLMIIFWILALVLGWMKTTPFKGGDYFWYSMYVLVVTLVLVGNYVAHKKKNNTNDLS